MSDSFKAQSPQANDDRNLRVVRAAQVPDETEEETAPASKKTSVELAIEMMTETYTVIQDQKDGNNLFIEVVDSDSGYKQVIDIKSEAFRQIIQRDFFLQKKRTSY